MTTSTNILLEKGSIKTLSPSRGLNQDHWKFEAGALPLALLSPKERNGAANLGLDSIRSDIEHYTAFVTE